MQQLDVSSAFYLRITVYYTEKLYREMKLLQRISYNVKSITLMKAVIESLDVYGLIDAMNDHSAVGVERMHPSHR